jgi:cation transport regulator ChaC
VSASWSQWAPSALGLAEVLLLLSAVYLTVSQFTRSRASSYIERFNSSDALASRIAVDRWLREHDTPRARLDAVERDPELLTHVRRFANLFQELGAAYQFRVAHRESVRVLFDALVVMYWEKLQFWIYDYRAAVDPTLYARFEYLYTRMSRQRRDHPRAAYVVGYGSLMDPASASAALGRAVTARDLVPVRLHGWERRWSVGEQVRLDGGRDHVTAAFLDVQPAESSAVSAVMIRISQPELKRLALREKNYEAHDLSSAARLTGGRSIEPRASVWCFVGSEEHQVRSSTHTAVILDEYLERVVGASRLVDPEIEAELRDAALVSGFPTVAGGYRFVDAHQAALV